MLKILNCNILFFFDIIIILSLEKWKFVKKRERDMNNVTNEPISNNKSYVIVIINIVVIIKSQLANF